ncbi:MAG TPA: TonB-dependent receptor, partial [Gemmatimonadaceae bacterium]|nr:TonB-dependent receptor [Gemmatimonadaceae bacterium]
YGTNAFFGIINIVTRSAAETPRAWARTSINSVNGSVTSAGFSTGQVKQQVRGSVSVMDRIGDTTTVDGIGEDLKGDASYSFTASLAAQYEGTFAQIRAYRYRRDDPFAPYNADPTVGAPYSEYNSQAVAEVGHTAVFSDRFTGVARAYGSVYEFYDHINQYQAPVFEDYGDAATVGLELRGRYELVKDALGLTAGTEGNYNITKSHSFEVGSDGVTVPKDFNIEGVYAELDGQPTRWLGFTGGVRYDRNSAIDNRASPRAALFISEPEKYGVKFLYAQGFRNPSAYEAFFYDGVTFAQPVGLHSETIKSFETVLWAKPIPGLSTRLSGYYWDARGIIEELQDPDNADLVQFQNVGRIVSEGVEAEMSYRNVAGWYAFGGADYSRVGSSDTTADVQFGQVVNSPAWTAAGGLSTPKLFDRVHLSGELNYIGARAARPNDAGDPVTSPAWLGLNLVAFAPNIAGFDFTLGIRNLLGTRDLMPAWPDFDRMASPNNVTITRVPGEGREYFLKVGYSYQ